MPELPRILDRGPMPAVTDEMRVAAVRSLARRDALDVADALGLALPQNHEPEGLSHD